MTTTHTASSPQKPALVADQSGAIMVIGVFMAVLAVGFMYYLIGVGETIFYRERMADAGDAGAWAAAVMHARGMNAIVLINMVMAAIAAVVLAIGAVLLIIDIGIVIATVLCAIPYTAAVGCPVKAALNGVRPTVKQIHDAAKRFADAVLPVLNKAATGVQYAVPWLAEVKVVNVSRVYHPPVDVGVFVSSTLYQGLPVEDSTCQELEDRGIIYVERLLGWATGDIPILSTVISWVGGLAARGGSAVYGGVCGGGGGEAGGELIAGAVSGATAAARDRAGCNDDPPPDPYPSMCDEEDPATGSVTAPEGSSSGDSDEKAPKKVKEDCNLGDECFQVRALMIGTPAYERTMKGVQIANWGRENSAGETYTTLAALGGGSFAQAEFYWDKEGEDGQEMRPEWMWEMNWRARLRRFRLPTETLMGEACSGGGEFCGALTRSSDFINSVIVH
jgi:hypothetical protein